MHINEKTFAVAPDSAIYIPPGAKQYIENTGNSDLIFLCIVDPAWRKEDEQILEGI
jgi:mannose-6-phosphate isomerase-like protein (cupin superfamily)